MAERSLFWDGAVLGDCGPYGQLHLHNQFFRSILNGTGDRGVLRGWLSELAVTGSTSPLTVGSGGAVIYGFVYESDAPMTVSIPTPSAGFSRYDRVVVRADWATQQARVCRVAGVAAAAPAVPALTQTANVAWEIPLATVLITDGGVITLTDTRDYASFTTSWPANAVTAAKYGTGCITPAKVPNRTRTDLRGAGSIHPDDTNPCAWTAGGSYDYWVFANAVTDKGWAYFQGPTGLVGGAVDIYAWSVPDVNGAGAGVENCGWTIATYYGPDGAGLTATVPAAVNVDQQLRVNTTVYADQLIAAQPINEGEILIIALSRDGAGDSYNSAMRLLGIEMRYTADA